MQGFRGAVEVDITSDIVQFSESCETQCAKSVSSNDHVDQHYSISLCEVTALDLSLAVGISAELNKRYNSVYIQSREKLLY